MTGALYMFVVSVLENTDYRTPFWGGGYGVYLDEYHGI
jgi:hypothetical protein